MRKVALGIIGLAVMAATASAAPKARGTPQRNPALPPGLVNNPHLVNAALHCLGSNGRPCQPPASP